jgi:NTE family protein
MLGAFEVGVMDALVRRGVTPDLLIGTSVGAVNAAYWAFNPRADAGEDLMDIWRLGGRSTFLPEGPIPVLRRLVWRRGHLLSSDGLARVFHEALGDRWIEESTIPLVVVAADARTGDRVGLRSGPAVPAILASAALPGVFAPVTIDGRQLIDGGVVANCDMEAAVEEGATDVLVVDVMGDSALAATDLLPTVERAVSIALRRQTDLALQAVSGRVRVAMLRPRLPWRPALGDFTHTSELFAMGTEAGAVFAARHLADMNLVRPGVLQIDLTEPVAEVPAGSADPGLRHRYALARRVAGRLRGRRRPAPALAPGAGTIASAALPVSPAS